MPEGAAGMMPLKKRNESTEPDHDMPSGFIVG